MRRFILQNRINRNYPEGVIEPTGMATRGKRPRWRWLAFAILGVSVLVYAVGPIVWQLSFGRPGLVDFYLHQSKYRDIVARAKELPLAAGVETSTRIDGLLVNAARSPAGSYTVTITAVDWHHAGVFGYVFSDELLTRIRIGITRTI